MGATRRVLGGGLLVVAAVAAPLAVLLGTPWLWAGAGACLVGGAAAAVGPGRARAEGTTAPVVPGGRETPDAPPTPEIDDLPGFFSSPPGSPAALPPAPTPDPAPDPAPEPGVTPPPAPTTTGPPGTATGTGTGAAATGSGSRARTGALVATTGVVVAVLVVGAVAWVSTRGSDAPSASAPSARSSSPPSSAALSSAALSSAEPSSAPLTAASAGDLAGTDVPPGEDGFRADLAFPGIVLEPRAVGVTVAYPALRVSGDGDRAVAHLELPVWNCLAADPPADPVAAQCSRSLVEYADLGSPDLAVAARGDGVDLQGTFATYTRPNGSAPSYTGRGYPVTVQLTPTAGGVAATLQLGDGEVAATGGGSVGR
ncbi:hypothetical protein TEK04_10275 [Klenkia sp. LSe6-5]|uniref:Uncharacterized protein n=1 Tax=Klenkia sesuvii TaxID=3103137 RepID=A0ABU8DTV8_9ACTN